MSHLRDIMQRLGQRHASGSDVVPEITPAGSAELERHRRDYHQRLRTCTPAMLRYEWTWLHRHLEDLELCRTNPEMLKVTGGRQHIDLLLSETRAYLDELEAEFRERGLAPGGEQHSVLSGEHAWDVSNATIRAQWGFDAGDA
jgi:hypothetical protein